MGEHIVFIPGAGGRHAVVVDEAMREVATSQRFGPFKSEGHL
ncbi:hypothetical protein AB0I53_23395 [Saccharopolyspora sp. NPDC050389]